MYKEDELIRIKSIHTKLADINQIIKRHNGIVQALSDIEGQPAILMLLIATAEQFNKLYSKDAEVIQAFDIEDIKGFISVRNFIAHDYDGINLALIENDLRVNIPKMMRIVEEILAS